MSYVTCTQGEKDQEKREARGESGGLWEDASQSGKARQLLLADGALVPREAFQPRAAAAKSIRNMAARSRSRSLVRAAKGIGNVLARSRSEPRNGAGVSPNTLHDRGRSFASNLPAASHQDTSV